MARAGSRESLTRSYRNLGGEPTGEPGAAGYIGSL
jgi:hypothetical protein